MAESLKYSVGCKIRWCGEEYEVLENHDDYYGVVRNGDEVIRHFYFSFQGENAVVIDDGIKDE